MLETGCSRVRGLATGTDRASGDKLPDVSHHHLPPEPLLDEGEGLVTLPPDGRPPLRSAPTGGLKTELQVEETTGLAGRASCTACSTVHLTVPTMQEGRMIGSSGCSFPLQLRRETAFSGGLATKANGSLVYGWNSSSKRMS